MKTPSLGELADQLYEHGKRVDEARTKLKELEKEEEVMEGTILSYMQEQKTDIVRGEVGTVSIVKYSRPQIDDFEAAARFIRRTGNLQLFERRIGSNAYKELMEQRKGKAIPGLSLYEEDRLRCSKRSPKS